MNTLRKEWIFTIGAFVLINVATLLLQPRFSFLGGHVWEQGTYYDLAQGFTRGIAPTGTAPAVFRFGVPLLASFLRFSDMVDGFLLVNVVATTLTIILLVLWLRLYIKSWVIRFTLLLFYMLHWLAPTRFTYFMPLNVDAWGMILLVTGLYFTARYRTDRALLQLVLVIIISLFGIAVRETVLLVPLTFAIALTYPKRSGEARFDLAAFLPIILAIVGLMIVRDEVNQIGNYHFLGAALNWGYAKPSPTYVLGWFVAFGPAIVLLLLDRNATVHFLTEHLWLAFYGIAFVILAYIGGSDTERILQWSSPVVLVLLGQWIERNRAIFITRWFLVAIILLQLISERAFFCTPDLTTEQPNSPLFLTSLSSHAYYLNLFSYHAPREISAVMLAEYLVVGISILLIAHFLGKKYGKRVGANSI